VGWNQTKWTTKQREYKGQKHKGKDSSCSNVHSKRDNNTTSSIWFWPATSHLHVISEEHMLLSEVVVNAPYVNKLRTQHQTRTGLVTVHGPNRLASLHARVQAPKSFSTNWSTVSNDTSAKLGQPLPASPSTSHTSLDSSRMDPSYHMSATTLWSPRRSGIDNT